ncbi:MAG: hypothetical protein K0S12_1932, partial [Bacteroidetes bacterium]|nr:hypothetical protein [Bacteroidota bacterium]
MRKEYVILQPVSEEVLQDRGKK